MLKPNLNEINTFLDGARNGVRLDPQVFVSFAKKYDSLVIWGAGNLGSAVGVKLLNLGVNISSYWDIQAEKNKVCNGVSVVLPLSGQFDREKTLVLFCIGNVAVGPNIYRQLADDNWRHVVHGNDLLQGLLCPLSNEKPANTKICNSFDICSVCSCERLHNIVKTNAARVEGIHPDDTLSFDRVHFITNNVCNLKCTHCFMYINSYSKDRKQNVDTFQIKQDIDIVMKAVHSFGVVNIFGGEPFMHKAIDQIISQVLSKENFGSVIVNTNGIAKIKPKQFIGMQDSRVRLAFSNYLEVLDEQKKKVFFNNIETAKSLGINTKYQNTLPSWNISSTLEDKNDSAETMIQKKKDCGVRYLYVFDGKLFPCAFAMSIKDLGVADYSSDYVELDPLKTPEEIRNEILKLIERPHYGACGHCESFGSPALTSTAAEQGFSERYIRPKFKNINRINIPIVQIS
jgi:organic radical activating enzyme